MSTLESNELAENPAKFFLNLHIGVTLMFTDRDEPYARTESYYFEKIDSEIVDE